MLSAQNKAYLFIGMTLAMDCSRVSALEAEDILSFRTGPLSIKPQMALTEVYSDNIFYLPKNEVDDFITMVSPGLKLQLGKPEKNYLALGYTFDELLYVNNPSLDTSQHTIDLSDRLQAQRLTLTGSDRIQILSSPLGGVERILSSRNIDRNSYNDNYTLSYDISERTAAYLRGTYSALDYNQGVDLYSSDTLTGTGGFAYRAFSKTSFFGEVYYGETTTSPNVPSLPKNPDVTFIGGYVGARGNFTEKLSGLVKVGYESREFSDGSSAPSQPVVDMSVTQRFTDKTALSLTYSRQNSVSSQYTRETFNADIIGLQLNQSLGPSRKWEASLGGSYYRYSYELGGQSLGLNYDYIRGSFNLAYKVQLWLTASLGYDFERLTGSPGGTTDYTVNRVNLRLAVGF